MSLTRDGIAALLPVSTLVIIVPGTDTLITVRNVVLGGRSAGMAAAAGVTVGQTLWVLMTSLGLAAAIKLLGAGYLVGLGVQSLARALRSSRAPVAPAPNPLADPGQRLGCARAFRNGLISNLGNPKMAVFFASVLPQFAPPGAGAFAGLAMLGVAFAAMTVAWLTAYAIAAAALGGRRLRTAAGRIAEGVAGTLLVAAGVRLAAQHR